MNNILFLCTGNSARSIMAEGYMNHAGKGVWRAYSAGSTPTGVVNPFALETLRQNDIATPDDPKSESWDVYASDDGPIMDAVITVCDNAASETCPVWPRHAGAAPRTLHCSFPDPAAAEGSDAEKLEAFDTIFQDIRTHIDNLLKDEQE